MKEEGYKVNKRKKEETKFYQHPWEVKFNLVNQSGTMFACTFTGY